MLKSTNNNHSNFAHFHEKYMILCTMGGKMAKKAVNLFGDFDVYDDEKLTIV